MQGELAVPGSKSIAQRVLVCAALSSGTTRIAHLPDSADVRAALALIEACGARVTRLAPAAISVSGRPPGPHRGWTSERALSAGESGTLARLATAAIALCGYAGRWIELEAEGTLRTRKSAALFAALRASGVEIENNADGWPARIRPIGPPSRIELQDPRSSQEVSALLIALAAYPDRLELCVRGSIPSEPYVELTRAVLQRFGVQIAPPGFQVKGPLVAPPDPVAIEPDASAAAVALAAGCLSGGEVRVRGLGSSSKQGDVRIVEYLRAFGCEAEARDDELVAHGFPARTVELDLGGEPDLAPVLAALAAAHAWRGGGVSRFTGLETLRGKESDRIAVLAAGFEAAGVAAEASADALRVGPRRSNVATPVLLDPAADHRMAFAFALLGLVRDCLDVSDPECVSKSWPRFWDELARAGASVAPARSGR